MAAFLIEGIVKANEHRSYWCQGYLRRAILADLISFQEAWSIWLKVHYSDPPREASERWERAWAHGKED